jgi:high-affinity iron transporter
MNRIKTSPILASLVLFSLPALAETATSGNPEAGKPIYKANCVLCHGAEGKGDGPAAAGFNPRPANYSQRNSTEERQIRIVTNGGGAEGLSPVMPVWGETLNPQQIKDVVAYVRKYLSAGKYSGPGLADAVAPAATAEVSTATAAVPAAVDAAKTAPAGTERAGTN